MCTLDIVKTYRVLAVGDTTWVVSEYCEIGDLFGAILPMEGVGDERRCVSCVSISLSLSLSLSHSDLAVPLASGANVPLRGSAS